jgi:hypothetical protein
MVASVGAFAGFLAGLWFGWSIEAVPSERPSRRSDAPEPIVATL